MARVDNGAAKISESPPPTLSLSGGFSKLAARSPDSSKRPVVVEIRASRAKLTTLSLRRPREDVFRLQLSLLQQMVEGGVDPARVAAVANAAKVIETIEVLQGGARER